MVPVGGLEPPHPKAGDFEKSAHTFIYIFQLVKLHKWNFAKTLHEIPKISSFLQIL